MKKSLKFFLGALVLFGIFSVTSCKKHTHAYGDGTVTKEATCTEKGVKTFTCECGDTYTEDILALGHNFGNEWAKDETNHWKSCTRCDAKAEIAGHTWNQGEVTTPATHTTKGVKTYTCTVCGQTKTEEVPADVNTHNWGEGVVTTPATCLVEGVRTFTCECGETKTEPISLAAHTLTEHEAAEATILAPGSVHYWSCSVCEKNFSDAEGTTEITGDVVIPQLVATVAQAVEAEVGANLIVRGVYLGTGVTGATGNFTQFIILKDLETNALIGVNTVEGTALHTALGTGLESLNTLPYEKGDVLELQLLVAQSPIAYCNGQAAMKYFKHTATEEDINTLVKSKGASYAINHDAQDIITISSQEDLFRLLGLKNGKNDPASEGYEYDYTVAGANTFKIVKFEYLYAVPYAASSGGVYSKQYYRIMMDSTISAIGGQVVSPKNTNGAKQNVSPVFNNATTKYASGKTFSEMVYGITEGMANGKYTEKLLFEGDIYAIFVGGNDYYCQFVILDENDVVKSGHKYGDLIPEVAATETAPGVKAHYVCSICGKFFVKEGEEYVEVTEQDLVIPALCVHEYTTKTQEAQYLLAEANCCNDALYYYACSKCGASAGQELNASEYVYNIPDTALGHGDLVAPQWEKVTDASTLKPGDMITFVGVKADGTALVFGKKAGSNKYYYRQTGTLSADGTILTVTDKCSYVILNSFAKSVDITTDPLFHLDTSWSFLTMDGYYIGISSTAGNLNSNKVFPGDGTNGYSWGITIDQDGKATVFANGTNTQRYLVCHSTTIEDPENKYAGFDSATIEGAETLYVYKYCENDYHTILNSLDGSMITYFECPTTGKIYTLDGKLATLNSYYAKVTSATVFHGGDKIVIANADSTKALSAVGKSSADANVVALTVENDIITSTQYQALNIYKDTKYGQFVITKSNLNGIEVSEAGDTYFLGAPSQDTNHYIMNDKYISANYGWSIKAGALEVTRGDHKTRACFFNFVDGDTPYFGQTKVDTSSIQTYVLTYALVEAN